MIKELFKKLQSELQSIYSNREANNISVIVFEDAFSIFNPLVNEDKFEEKEQIKFNQIVADLMAGRPWQYVLGQADFYGLKLKVNSAVLIPRSETEELVYWIKEQNNKSPLRILDIGTGSGCIAIGIKNELPQTKVMAVDVDARALEVAKKNAGNNSVSIDFMEIDILNEMDWAKIPQQDLIVSNPPYITQKERKLMPKHVLEHEPDLALFVANQTPLIFYDKISNFAMQNLSINGWLYFEINEYYGKESLELLQKKGFVSCELKQDFSGKDRMLKGQWNG